LVEAALASGPSSGQLRYSVGHTIEIGN